MRFIDKVTVTGADDTTSVRDLIDIHEKYPFVEFGILLSRKQIGTPRFPSKEWLHDAVELMFGRGINISGHICGSWVREILMGNWPFKEMEVIHPSLLDARMLKRFQLNTHAEPHTVDLAKMTDQVAILQAFNQRIIIQNDGVNTELLKIPGIETLFDLSHGAGILPENWPKPIDGINCGYAGGLSPDNVADQIAKIETIVGGRTIWIDAETHLRTYSPKDRFDLNLVRAFLKASEPFVIRK